MFAVFSTVTAVTMLLLTSFNFQEVKSVTCTYEQYEGYGYTGYTCNLVNQTIKNKLDMQENGAHMYGLSAKDVVTLIATESSVIEIFPSQLMNKFINLKYVILNNVGMHRFEKPMYSGQSLSVVMLTSNEISVVPENICQKCDQLQELNLNDNQINSIHDLAFSGMSKLQHLSLTNNQIDNINAEIFTPITNLQSLHLSNNAIREISSQTFEPLSSLKNLWLNNNNITTWNSTLQGNLDLEELILDENKISTLSDDVFSNLPQLRVLRVGGLLEKIPILTNTSSLEELGLNNNRIKQVSADSFSNLVNLKNLDLSYNNIESVNFTMQSTTMLPILDTLNLTRNNISKIYEGTFTMLSNLTNLDLSGNGIEVLEAESIRPIKQIKRLDVSHNQINRIERDFFTGVTNLNFVSLGNRCFDNQVNISDSNDFENRVAALLEPCFNFATLPKVNIFVTVGMVLFTFIWKM